MEQREEDPERVVVRAFAGREQEDLGVEALEREQELVLVAHGDHAVEAGLDRVGEQRLEAAVLGLEPLEQSQPKPAVTPRRSRAQIWAANLAAARQYHQREGHLDVPRKHIETVGAADHALGVFIANSRVRKDKLASQRIQELTAIGMRWA